MTPPRIHAPDDPLFEPPLRRLGVVGFVVAGATWSVAVDAAAYLVLRGLGMGGRYLHDTPSLRGSVLASHILVDVVGPPVVWALYAWLRRASGHLIQDLARGQVLLDATTDHEPLLPERGIAGAARRYAWLIGLAVAAAGTLQHVTHPPGWNDASALHAQLRLAASIPLWYALWMSIATASVAAATLWAAFRRSPVRVHVFHPDGYGGFGPLRAFIGTLIAFLLTISALLAVAVAIATVTAQVSGDRLDRILVVYVLGFLVIAPTILLAVIWPAHRAMVQARAHFADGLSRLIGPPASSARAPLTSADLARLHEAQRASEILRTFPVWPFDPSGLRGALVGILSPLLLGMMVEIVARIVLR